MMRLIVILSSVLMLVLGTACERRQADQGTPGVQPTEPGGERVGAPGGELGGEEREPVAGREGAAAGEGLILIDQSGQQMTLHDQNQIRKIEEGVKKEGLDPGTVDGKADEKLSNAIREFQQKRGLPATGYLNMQTAEALGLDWQQIQQSAHKGGAMQPGSEGMKQPRGMEGGAEGEAETGGGATP